MLTDVQFLKLMKTEIADFYFEDQHGKYKSTLQALELIKIYRQQIEEITLRNYQKTLAIKNENNRKNRPGNIIPPT